MLFTVFALHLLICEHVVLVHICAVRLAARSPAVLKIRPARSRTQAKAFSMGAPALQVRFTPNVGVDERAELMVPSHLLPAHAWTTH